MEILEFLIPPSERVFDVVMLVGRNYALMLEPSDHYSGSDADFVCKSGNIFLCSKIFELFFVFFRD